MNKKGYDISVWQDGLDLNKIPKESFAIIRAGFSTTQDRCFNKFYKQLKANGVPVGAYWYSYAHSETEARAEARKCIEVLKGKQFELPIYFDVEQRETLNKGKVVVSNIVKAFCNELEKAKYFVGIYMSRSAILSYLTDEVQKRYALWVADWTGSCKYNKNRSWKETVKVLEYFKKKGSPLINGTRKEAEAMSATLHYKTQFCRIKCRFHIRKLMWLIENGADINAHFDNYTGLDYLNGNYKFLWEDDFSAKDKAYIDKMREKFINILLEHGAKTMQQVREEESHNEDYKVELQRMS